MTKTATPRPILSPAEYRQRLFVDADGGPRLLRDVADPWQVSDFLALDPAWSAVITGTATDTIQRAYLERGRGHSKTTDTGVMTCYGLYAAQRAIKGVVAAGDSDQAALLRDRISALCEINPPLRQVLDVQKSVVRNTKTGSELSVISSDAATSYGLLPDFIVCDELTHWDSTNGEQLWHSLFSSAAKRANCLLIVISNAGLGMGTSWQWRVREAARTDPAWFFSRLSGPQASWITPARLAEQARFLPPSAYRKLWLNEWLSSAGDALDEADIKAAIDPNAGPLFGDEPNLTWIAGLDLGVKRDRSALCVLGVDQLHERSQLADCRAWSPVPGGAVDLEAVRLGVLDAAHNFPGLTVGFDPHQAQFMAVTLRREGVNMIELPFSGRTLPIMAACVLQAFRNRSITLYNDPALIADLGKLMIVEKSYGYRLEASRDASGHADLATALAIALAMGTEAIGSYVPVVDDGLGEFLI